METIKLIIDNKEVEVPRGTTILDAAKSVGIHIPTLCYMKLEDLHYENNPGACRICVVEIEGRRPESPADAAQAGGLRDLDGRSARPDGDGADPLESSGGMPDM